MFSARAQGTIEYLIIISIIIVIGLVVVGLMSGFLSTSQGTNQTLSKIKTQTGTIAITETSTNPDGNYLIRLQSNDPDNITITNIKIADTNQNYTQTLPQGSAQNFEIDTTNTCTTGTTTTQTITITYTTQYGITKTTTLENVTFPCENYSITTTATPTTEETDTTPPTIQLMSPAIDYSTTSADSNINFIFKSTTESVTDCNLYVDGTWYDRNQSTVAQDTNIILDMNLASLSDGDHTWDINCSDSSGNIGTATDRNINYTTAIVDTTPPTIFLLSPIDYDVNTNATITFDFNILDDTNTTPTQCTLYLDGTDANSNPTFIDANNGYFTYTFGADEDAIYDWTVNCSDGTNTNFPDTNRQINMDQNDFRLTFCDELDDMSGNGNPDEYYVLAEDINCYTSTATSSADEWGSNLWNDGNGFYPIWYGDAFEGIFDGNNHSIYGLHINRPSGYVGLFEGITTGALVKDLHLVDVNITGGTCAAGITSTTVTGTEIRNVSVSGYVSGQGSAGVDSVGGVGLLVGYNEGTIRNSYTTGQVVCTSATKYGCGGLVGINSSIKSPWNDEAYIYASFSTADVNGYNAVGGFVGHNGFIIEDSYSTGNVKGTTLHTGGFAGSNGGYGNNFWITRSYATGNVIGGEVEGGFVGKNYGGDFDSNVTYSFSTGSVTGPEEEGAFFGTNSYFSNENYAYNQSGDSADACANGVTTGCTLIEDINGGLNWFYTDGNNPLAFWDFSVGGQWVEVSEDYPDLNWE